MFSKLLKKQFATATQKDLLSTKNMKKFLVGDFPAALEHSRPFSISFSLSRNDYNFKRNYGSKWINVKQHFEVFNKLIDSVSVFIKCGSRDET